MEATRERIVQAAFDLHREIGPAQTTISAIAARAGVERHTVYRHFPDLVGLMRACTEHGMRTTGLPEPSAWRAIADPYARLRTALREMYRYWRDNEQLVANILRDAPVMPELVEGSARYRDHLGGIWQAVLEPWASTPGVAGERARAIAGIALEFGTWQSLARRYGMSDDAAVEAMVAAVKGVASGSVNDGAGF
ncbi:MAG: TetR/AcrR family transcriptional regulator [Chloroflexota bacterium]|nr:TetR/AcrR family transcriptional regulator [Chloroflexota bacterium]